MARRWRDPFTASLEHRRAFVTDRWWMTGAVLVAIGGLLLTASQWYTSLIAAVLMATGVTVVGVGFFKGPRGSV